MFTKREIRDLIVSIIVLALAFAGFSLELFPTTLLVIILIFVTHELAHKFLAMKYGAEAHYRAWPTGLLIGLISGMFGFVFAAPGAVVISPIVKKKFAFIVARLTRKQIGLISVSGPVTNIIIGFLFLVISLFYPLAFLTLVSRISFFLAFFNLIPFLPLDGGKVLRWNKYIWFLVIALSITGLIYTQFSY